MKTAGIVMDNYKIAQFKKELIAKGFSEIEVVPFTKHVSTIKVKYKDDLSLKDIASVCKSVELHFKHSN